MREHAAASYDERVVAAFFDYLLPEAFDPWTDREAVLRLPAKDEGYATLQMVGTTGAGKTTLLRQLIGADPATERFPSTSAAKTTVADIEIIIADGPFKAAVSFLPRDQVRQYIADCVAAAVSTHIEGGSLTEVMRRFLEHAEQRFRLSYLLGAMPVTSAEDEEADDSDDEVESSSADHHEMVAADEKQRLNQILTHYRTDVTTLAEKTAAQVANQLGEAAVESLAAKDKDAFEEIVESELVKEDDFHGLVDRILDDVESRFELLTHGVLERSRDGWPKLWHWESSDRAEFIRVVNRFSSNSAPAFGRLLTPIVQGIRVRGPFAPTWDEGSNSRLVLLDGQGIGHTADSNSSVSTAITKRFQLADLILVADDAAQPLQAAACAALHSIVSSGNAAKLVMCFTHFDEVKGDNLVGDGASSSIRARKAHVVGSFDNAIRAIGKTLGRESEHVLKRLIPERLLYFSNIQFPLKEKNELTRKSFLEIARFASAAIAPPKPIEYEPLYDVVNLVLAVQKATEEFQQRWKGVLGMEPIPSVGAEHWTRVKALSRWVGVLRKDEYDTLKPVADLIRMLQDQISAYLSVPWQWEPGDPATGDQQRCSEVLDRIRQEVFGRLHSLSTRRLIQQHLPEWVTAYEHRGPGSTRVRARELRSLYEEAAPVPNVMPAKAANEFLLELRQLVKEAIETGGGRVVGWESAPVSKNE